jgi:hypothetical protein
VLYNWDEGRHNAIRPENRELREMMDKPGLHRVDCVPMGCTSISRGVLTQWPASTGMFCSPVNPDNGRTMTDDIYFCRMAQDQGYPIYVDTSLEVGHRLTHYVHPSFFTAWDAKQATANGISKLKVLK